MFGLGRASTQSTLASVESGSTFPPRACVDRPGQQPALQVEAVSGTSGSGLLTTITERRSPAPSRSSSNARTRTPTLAAASLTGETAGADVGRERPRENRILSNDTAPASPYERTLHPQTPTLRRLRTIGRRFKRHFSAKRREWKLRLQILHAHGAGMAGDTSASASTAERFSGPERSDHVEELVNATGGDTEDRHASIRAKRRDLTLAREREAALNAKCECGPECLCINGSHVVEIDGAEMPENIHVPEWLFRRPHSSTGSSNSQPSPNGAQGLDLVHIGVHFDSSQRSSSVDESSSAAENGTRRVRLSQGSTLWSNGSCVSLRPRRPQVGRASSMPVGSRARYLAGARTGFHTNSSFPGIRGWPEATRAPRSFDEGSMAGRTGHADSSRNGEGSSHESSTSLAVLSDPQDEQRLIDGVSPASHTPMRDGDEVTPTRHSGIRSDGDLNRVSPVGSAGLSGALQDLANRETTDHDVHSPGFLANGPSD